MEPEIFKGVQAGDLRTEVPQWDQGYSPGRESGGRSQGGRSPPEAEAKCEFSVQCLTFSCIKFRI